MKLLKVGILFGGKSAEHDVSIQSAQSILNAIDTALFDPVLIKISREGMWFLQESISKEHGTELKLNLSDHTFETKDGAFALDVIFPVLHGPFGEDGTVQGLLEIAGIPYVGSAVLGSAINMDKDTTKRLLRDAGLPTANFEVIKSATDYNAAQIIAKLGLPLFVKPANLGSSVGISKVTRADQLLPAVRLALQHDKKVVIETAIVGTEIECAVLGNANPKVSTPGRITFADDFYTYEAKYSGSSGTQLEIPAKLSPSVQKDVQALALAAYKTLECRGLARVDMFVTPDGQVIVNEINTMPGFTKFSMYPQLWQASGLSYTELITTLIRLAQE